MAYDPSALLQHSSGRKSSWTICRIPAIPEDEVMGREIDALNHEMKAAGVRVFVGGLQPESSARPPRLQPAGKMLITGGPCAETKEHIGGFWVPRPVDLDDALSPGDAEPVRGLTRDSQ